MGARGPRSAADMTAIRPDQSFSPINFDEFARNYSDRREATRALVRAERRGMATRRVLQDGSTEWHVAGDIA